MGSVTDIPEADLCRWLFSDPIVSVPLFRDLELEAILLASVLCSDNPHRAAR